MNYTPAVRSGVSLSAVLLSVSAAPSGLAAEVTASKPTVRIKTGISKPLTDETGVVWQPDHGFADGDTIERPNHDCKHEHPLTVSRGALQHDEIHDALPNGKYIVKLHFAETFEGIIARVNACSRSPCKERNSRTSTCSRNPAASAAPTSKPFQWKSAPGSSRLRSSHRSRILKSTPSKSSRCLDQFNGRWFGLRCRTLSALWLCRNPAAAHLRA